jgi:SF-assemblin/beta giardin
LGSWRSLTVPCHKISLVYRFQIRKEREEYSVAELRVRISKLEQALGAEVKRRVEATHELQATVNHQVAQMEKRLQKQLSIQSATLSERLQRLETKLEQMERRWDKESQEQIEFVLKKGDTFEALAKQLKTEIESEKKSRLVREGRFLQQLESHAADLEKKWTQESEERSTAIATLTQQLSVKEKQRVEEQVEWQSRIDRELFALTRELQEEIMERETQDESTVAALNQFTHQLQSSLAILNGE